MASEGRALDRLRNAADNHARAVRKLERLELERARAIIDARAAGYGPSELGAFLGLSHVRIVQLSRWAAERGVVPSAPADPSVTDPSATVFEPDGTAETGPPGPEVTDPSATAEPLFVQVAALAPPPDEEGRVTFTVGRAETCARLGCRASVTEGSRFCPEHARY